MQFLHIEPCVPDHLRIRSALAAAGIDGDWRRVDSVEALGDGAAGCDIALTDCGGPPDSVEATVRRLRERVGAAPVVVVAHPPGESAVLAALQAGASEFVLKPGLDGLVEAVRRTRAPGEFQSFGSREFPILAEAVSDSILLIDEESRLVFVNAVVERMFDRTAQERIGRELTVLMPERLRAEKLKVHSIAGLTKFAVRHGLCRLD
jgi:PAS domain-containing protein